MINALVMKKYVEMCLNKFVFVNFLKVSVRGRAEEQKL